MAYIVDWEGKGWRFIHGHIKREDAYAQAKDLRRLSRAGCLRLNYRVEFTFGAGVYCVFERETLAVKRAALVAARKLWREQHRRLPLAKSGTGVLSLIS